MSPDQKGMKRWIGWCVEGKKERKKERKKEELATRRALCLKDNTGI